MIEFKEPKNKTVREIEKLILQAVRDGSDFVGDLTAKDAEIAVEILERNDFTVTVETETDRRGALVESNDWKLVRFALKEDSLCSVVDSEGNPASLPTEIADFLKSSGVDGVWNFWERDDGTFHREYQMCQGADYLVKKTTRAEGIELVVEQSK